MIATRRLILIASTVVSAADALPPFLGWLEAAPDKAGWFGWHPAGTRFELRAVPS